MALKGYKQDKKHIQKRFENRKKNGYWKNPEKTKKKLGELLNGYKQTEKFKKAHKESLIGNTNGFKKGRKHSKDWRIKHSKKMRGKNNPMKRLENRQKIREWHINNPNRKFKDTGIELKMEAELQRRNINYQKQVPLCNIAIVDFYLPEYRIVIQCDGDYWHNKKGAKERDEKQDKVLIFNGFNVYRFWGSEINKSVQKCINKLKVFN